MPVDSGPSEGRTTRMLRGVFEDLRSYTGIVLVVFHLASFKDYARLCLREWGASDDELNRIYFFEAEGNNNIHRVRGRRFSSMHVDHFVYESCRGFMDVESELMHHLMKYQIPSAPTEPRLSVWELLMLDD